MRILRMREKKWQFPRIGDIAVLGRSRSSSPFVFLNNIEDLHVKKDVMSVWILIILGNICCPVIPPRQTSRRDAWKLFIQKIPESFCYDYISQITFLVLHMSCNKFIAGSRASLQLCLVSLPSLTAHSSYRFSLKSADDSRWRFVNPLRSFNGA